MDRGLLIRQCRAARKQKSDLDTSLLVDDYICWRGMFLKSPLRFRAGRRHYQALLLTAEMARFRGPPSWARCAAEDHVTNAASVGFVLLFVLIGYVVSIMPPQGPPKNVPASRSKSPLPTADEEIARHCQITPAGRLTAASPSIGRQLSAIACQKLSDR